MLVRFASPLRFFLLAALAALLLAPMPARAVRINQYEQPELFAEHVTCRDATVIAQQFVPYFMVADEPDSLLGVLDWWEYNCGSAEPIRRTRILASIWDGAFEESLYDMRLFDDLAWRWDEARAEAQQAGEISAAVRVPVASHVDYIGDAVGYDRFTEDIADQLLPHARRDTPEEFFCLFYSGRVDEAWALLQGGALDDSQLHRLYVRELEDLAVPSYRDFAGVSGGYWMSTGGLERVGDHWYNGAFVGRRWPRAVLRGEISLRYGRSDWPYAVLVEEQPAWSDRFGVVSLGIEGGPSLVKAGPVTLDLLAGVGLEGLKPFKEEDDIVLIWPRAWLGGGLHWEFGDQGVGFLDLDLRHEWLGDPQKDGTDLGGRAWGLRMAVGFSLVPWQETRLANLGQ